jgi:hypothetical protein
MYKEPQALTGQEDGWAQELASDAQIINCWKYVKFNTHVNKNPQNISVYFNKKTTNVWKIQNNYFPNTSFIWEQVVQKNVRT